MKQVHVVDVPLGKKTFFETDHKDGHSVVLLNENHPLVEEIGWRLHAMKNCNEENIACYLDLAKAVTSLADILLLSYAKAESMFFNPERFSLFRSSWGHILADYLK